MNKKKKKYEIPTGFLDTFLDLIEQNKFRKVFLEIINTREHIEEIWVERVFLETVKEYIKKIKHKNHLKDVFLQGNNPKFKRHGKWFDERNTKPW